MKKFSIFQNYAYLFHSIWNYNKKFFIYSGMEVIFSVLAPFGGVLIPAVIIGLLEQGGTFKNLIFYSFIAFFVFGILSGLQSYLTRRNSFQYLEYRMGYQTAKLIHKCLTMDYEQIENEEIQKDRWKAMDCLTGNMFGMEGMIRCTVKILIAGIGMLVYCCIITNINPLIVVLLIFISFIQYWFYGYASKQERKNKDKKAEFTMHYEYLDRQAYDIVSGKDIRLYKLDTWLTKIFKGINKKYHRILMKEKGYFYIYDLMGVILTFLRDAICYGYLIYQLVDGMAISNFVLYIGVIRGFSGFFINIMDEAAKIGRFHYTVSDLRNFLDRKDTFFHGEGVVLDEGKKAVSIEFSHVCFSYPGSDKKILDDISFRIDKEEKLALVGINGAGKTTIVKLICGFYKPQSGTILINGISVNDLDIDQYFKQIAVVFQEAFTYSFSIGENVSGKANGIYDRVKCEKALKMAGLWNKIEKFPKKMDTYLNHDMEMDGIQISGGELQKLILARAIYKDANLLILDEPTAALDAIAETQMYESYKELIGKSTSLFISHRLASTRICDSILFLEHGRIKEKGTHQELMKRKGSYAHMFEIQSKYYKEGDTANEEKFMD